MTAHPSVQPLAGSVRRKSRRGSFITLEGGEGAGKSTQQQMILERLEAAGIEAIGTREPGGSPHAEELRQILLSGAVAKFGTMAEALMFSAARIDHLDNRIRPALDTGTWVVCDRFSDSTRAYQGALGNIDARVMDALENVTLGGCRPDLTLILDLPAEVGLARAAARRGTSAPVDRFEAEEIAFHRALRASFRDIAAAEPERCVLIDASANRAVVAETIWQAICVRLLSARQQAKARGVTLGNPAGTSSL